LSSPRRLVQSGADARLRGGAGIAELPEVRGFRYREGGEERQMAQQIQWGRDFGAALESVGDRLVLLDFSAAPM
jgi:hypothetical protein